MRTLERVRVGAGWLAVAVMLALASPGVRVVRAEDAGPRPEARQVQSDAEVEAFLREIRRERRRARAPSEPRGAGVVVLNTRGYNFGAPPAVRLGPRRAGTGASR